MEFEKAPNPLPKPIELATSREISACVSVAMTNEDCRCVVTKINVSASVLSYWCSNEFSDRHCICYKIYCILIIVIAFLFKRTCYSVRKYISEFIYNYRVWEGAVYVNMAEKMQGDLLILKFFLRGSGETI